MCDAEGVELYDGIYVDRFAEIGAVDVARMHVRQKVTCPSIATESARAPRQLPPQRDRMTRPLRVRAPACPDGQHPGRSTAGDADDPGDGSAGQLRLVAKRNHDPLRIARLLDAATQRRSDSLAPPRAHGDSCSAGSQRRTHAIGREAEHDDDAVELRHRARDVDRVLNQNLSAKLSELLRASEAPSASSREDDSGDRQPSTSIGRVPA
jgi:hypothetical protein